MIPKGPCSVVIGHAISERTAFQSSPRIKTGLKRSCPLIKSKEETSPCSIMVRSKLNLGIGTVSFCNGTPPASLFHQVCSNNNSSSAIPIELVSSKARQHLLAFKFLPSSRTVVFSVSVKLSDCLTAREIC